MAHVDRFFEIYIYLKRICGTKLVYRKVPVAK